MRRGKHVGSAESWRIKRTSVQLGGQNLLVITRTREVAGRIVEGYFVNQFREIHLSIARYWREAILALARVLGLRLTFREKTTLFWSGRFSQADRFWKYMWCWVVKTGWSAGERGMRMVIEMIPSNRDCRRMEGDQISFDQLHLGKSWSTLVDQRPIQRPTVWGSGLVWGDHRGNSLPGTLSAQCL